MDSVIVVAGMLLQAGFTIADLAGEAEREQKLDTVSRGFPDAPNMDWNFFNSKGSTAHRDRSRKLHTDGHNSRNALHPITMDENHCARPFRDAVAKDFRQFRYLGQDRSVRPCSPG
jgi:hypothetical protein